MKILNSKDLYAHSRAFEDEDQIEIVSPLPAALVDIFLAFSNIFSAFETE